MCKKLVLAAVAILVGTAVVRHTSIGSLAQVWWHDAKTTLERQVPPEVQIKQLEVEVNKIDRDIKSNLSRLAAQEVDTQKLEENVAALKEDQTRLRASVEALTACLKGDSAGNGRITFNGREYSKSYLTSKLSTDVARFESRKAELKAKEKLLDLKKQAVEAAHDRIAAMADQKEKLRVTIAKFETRQELNRLNAVRAEAGVELDDSQVARCNELAAQIERRLDVQAKETDMFTRYGYGTPGPKVEQTRPTAEVVEAAERALNDKTVTAQK